MNKLLIIIAAALASGAVAAEVPEGSPTLTPAEKAAPTVDCYMDDGWCYVKSRMPDGTLVSTAVKVDGEGIKGASRVLKRPQVSAR